MSAMPFDHSEQSDDHDEPGQFEETAVAATPVVVRRNAAVAALVGAAASSVAIAYLWRASQTATVLDWTLCGVMALIAGFYLASLVDSRTPLLVADDLGVRIRLGNEWRGLPWEAIGQVVVHPRKGDAARRPHRLRAAQPRPRPRRPGHQGPPPCRAQPEDVRRSARRSGRVHDPSRGLR